MDKLNPYIDLAGRILISSIFVLAGVNKITGFDKTQAYMAAKGVPGMLLYLVILLEIGGGVALIAGWQTRAAAFLLAGFTLLAAVIFHNQLDNQMQMILFMKNLAIVGGLLFLVKHGAGELSLDHRRHSGAN